MLASAWGGPGTPGGTDQIEVWREAAVRIVPFSYDGDGNHNVTTLLPDVSQCHNVVARSSAATGTSLGPASAYRRAHTSSQMEMKEAAREFLRIHHSV